MNEPKRENQVKVMEREYEKVVDQMCDAILDSVKEGYHSELEPWEVYEKKVRAQVSDNMHQFRERFTKGYQVLLEELQKDDEAPRAEGPPADDEGIIRP